MKRLLPALLFAILMAACSDPEEPSTDKPQPTSVHDLDLDYSEIECPNHLSPTYGAELFDLLKNAQSKDAKTALVASHVLLGMIACYGPPGHDSIDPLIDAFTPLAKSPLEKVRESSAWCIDARKRYADPQPALDFDFNLRGR